MKLFTSLFATLALLSTALPALAQSGPTQYRVDSINALLQITLFGSDAKVTAWVGGGSARDDGLGGMFFYDGNSSAVTNVYAVFKPVNNNGRWWKLPTSVAYQTAAVNPAIDTEYAWKLLRGAGATNLLGIGADNDIAYIQTFSGKNLHINNIGNNTILNATSGNVGVRTANPLTALHVDKTVAKSFGSSGNAVLYLRDTTSMVQGVGATLYFSGYNTAQTSTSTLGIIDGYKENGSAGDESGALRFHTGNSGGVISEWMRITSAGLVGVGTTAPASLTEIQGGLTTSGAILTLGTKEPSVVLNDVLGRINFYAPLDAAGTDANLVAGSIATVAEGTFSATSNASSLIFQTGASETATTKLTLSSTGVLTLVNGEALNNTVDGTVNVTDGSNSLMTIVDAGTTGNVTATGTLTATLGAITASNGNVVLGTAGNGFQIKEGSNARMGTATLSGGTIAVSNTSAATGDRIFIQRVSGTAAEFGHLSYTISNGVSFTVNSTDAQDDSVVNWLIIKPTP